MSRSGLHAHLDGGVWGWNIREVDTHQFLLTSEVERFHITQLCTQTLVYFLTESAKFGV